MTRKFGVAFLILLACVALFFSICLVILFLAPGTEILGVRYIANGISRCEMDNINLSDLTNREQFSGNIYIETYGVPIRIEYTPYYTSHISFHQDFIGLTKSKDRVANLETAVDDKDDLHISAHEIVPWLYSHKGTDNYFLTIYLAVDLVGRDLHVNSTKSNVTIINGPQYKTLEIRSAGELKVEGDVYAENLIYHTSTEVTVGETLSCLNADLGSTNNNVNVITAIDGDLKAETRGGDIRFVSCKSLDATTDSGDVTQYGDGLNSVKGEVNIKTRSGNVTLGNVGVMTEDTEDKSEYLNINSVSGAISITSMLDGDVSSDRGRITISMARNLVVASKTGDVNINSVTNELVINGRNGKVVVGEGGVINNPTIKTTTGTITAYNTSGKIDLESKSNAIDLTNRDSDDITLNAGRALTAKRLQGKVEAKANGDVEMTFEHTPTEFNLNVGSRGKKVNIDATCADYKTVNYNIRSTRGKKAQIFAGDELLVEGSSLISNPQVEGFPTFNIRTSYGEVTLRLS